VPTLTEAEARVQQAVLDALRADPEVARRDGRHQSDEGQREEREDRHRDEDPFHEAVTGRDPET
jgi:hypothetical protein